MIVELPNGDKVDVQPEDVAAFERMLKKMFAQPKEKTLDEVMSEFSDKLITAIDKHNTAMVKSLVQSVKAIDFPDTTVNVPEFPVITPISAVSIEEGSVTWDKRTGRINGMRLLIEREE